MNMVSDTCRQLDLIVKEYSQSRGDRRVVVRYFINNLRNLI